jgi:hypothetical protein
MAVAFLSDLPRRLRLVRLSRAIPAEKVDSGLGEQVLLRVCVNAKRDRGWARSPVLLSIIFQVVMRVVRGSGIRAALLDAIATFTLTKKIVAFIWTHPANEGGQPRSPACGGFSGPCQAASPANIGPPW